MQKSQSVLGAPRNFFALNRTKPDCYYPPVRVDFNPSQTPRSAPPSILPSFNHDRNYFTPSFLLPADKPYYSSNSAAECSKFTQKMQAEDAQPSISPGDIQQVGFEVKAGDSRYCQICQLKFEDYWQHVAQQSHLRRLHLSPSTAHIQELCASFNTTHTHNHPNYPLDNHSKTASRRRGRKGKEEIRVLQGCRSSDMLNALHSTQIMAEGGELGWR